MNLPGSKQRMLNTLLQLETDAAMHCRTTQQGPAYWINGLPVVLDTAIQIVRSRCVLATGGDADTRTCYYTITETGREAIDALRAEGERAGRERQLRRKAANRQAAIDRMSHYEEAEGAYYV